jgi:hypothetical protein
MGQAPLPHARQRLSLSFLEGTQGQLLFLLDFLEDQPKLPKEVTQ